MKKDEFDPGMVLTPGEPFDIRLTSDGEGTGKLKGSGNVLDILTGMIDGFHSLLHSLPKGQEEAAKWISLYFFFEVVGVDFDDMSDDLFKEMLRLWGIEDV